MTIVAVLRATASHLRDDGYFSRALLSLETNQVSAPEASFGSTWTITHKRSSLFLLNCPNSDDASAGS